MDDTFSTQDILAQLQQPQTDPWNQLNSQFGRLAVSVPRMSDVLKALGRGAMAPLNAANNILQQGDLLPSQMNINPGREGLIASSALMPGIGTAEEGLGVMGGMKAGISSQAKMPASYYTEDRIAQMHELLIRQRQREQTGSSLSDIVGSGASGPRYKQAALTNNDVNDITALSNAGVPISKLSDYFGVDRQTLYRAINKGYAIKPPAGSARSSPISTNPETHDIIRNMSKGGENSTVIADYLENKYFNGAVEITPSMVRQTIKQLRDKGLFATGAPIFGTQDIIKALNPNGQ